MIVIIDVCEGEGAGELPLSVALFTPILVVLFGLELALGSRESALVLATAASGVVDVNAVSETSSADLAFGMTVKP